MAGQNLGATHWTVEDSKRLLPIVKKNPGIKGAGVKAMDGWFGKFSASCLNSKLKVCRTALQENADWEPGTEKPPPDIAGHLRQQDDKSNDDNYKDDSDVENFGSSLLQEVYGAAAKPPPPKKRRQTAPTVPIPASPKFSGVNPFLIQRVMGGKNWKKYCAQEIHEYNAKMGYGPALPTVTAPPPATQVQSLVYSKAGVKAAKNFHSNLCLHEVVRFYDAGSKLWKVIVFLRLIHDTTFVISVSPDGRKLLVFFQVDPRDKGAQLASTQAIIGYFGNDPGAEEFVYEVNLPEAVDSNELESCFIHTLVKTRDVRNGHEVMVKENVAVAQTYLVSGQKSEQRRSTRS
ncbi:hypothetical protein BDR26DRAFT_863264 [Obelidium mucronatum]|nr:hypothetical protein BDR26DRAFT_863264 [Obelidium mucronatum]